MGYFEVVVEFFYEVGGSDGVYALVGKCCVGCCCWFFCWVGGCVVVVVLPVVVVWDEVACFWVYFSYCYSCVGGLFVLVAVGFGDFVDVLVFACFSYDYALFW